MWSERKNAIHFLNYSRLICLIIWKCSQIQSQALCSKSGMKALKVNLPVPVRVLRTCKFSFHSHNSISKVQRYKGNKRRRGISHEIVISAQTQKATLSRQEFSLQRLFPIHNGNRIRFINLYRVFHLKSYCTCLWQTVKSSWIEMKRFVYHIAKKSGNFNLTSITFNYFAKVKSRMLQRCYTCSKID